MPDGRAECLHGHKKTVCQPKGDNIRITQTTTGEIDLLGIDIDRNDYDVWEAIECITPRVVVAEYNAKFPPHYPMSVKDLFNPARYLAGIYAMGYPASGKFPLLLP